MTRASAVLWGLASLAGSGAGVLLGTVLARALK